MNDVNKLCSIKSCKMSISPLVWSKQYSEKFSFNSTTIQWIVFTMASFQKIYLFANVYLIIVLVIIYSVIVAPASDSNSDLCKCKNVNSFNQIRPRIVNGTEVLNNDLPFVASLFAKKITYDTGTWRTSFISFCTGSSEFWFWSASNWILKLFS